MLSQYIWSSLTAIVISKLSIVASLLILVLVLDKLFTLVIHDYSFKIREKVTFFIRHNLKWLRG